MYGEDKTHHVKVQESLSKFKREAFNQLCVLYPTEAGGFYTCRTFVSLLMFRFQLLNLNAVFHCVCRIAYSKMAEEVCGLLLSDIGEGSTCDDQLSCFDTAFSAPIPEDLRSSYLQGAVSVFTCFLSEVAT